MREEIIKIEKIGGEGVGIGRISGKIVFVPFTAPGDTIRASIVSEKASFMRGAVMEILEASNDRTTPPCPVFGLCGGCSFQHMAYERQLAYKAALVREIFRHYAGAGTDIRGTVPSDNPYGYRNKLRLKCGIRGGMFACGFYGHKSHTLVPTDACMIASPMLERMPGKLAELLSEAARGEDGRPGHDLRIRASEIHEIILHSSDESKKATITFVTRRKSNVKQDPLVSGIIDSIPAVSGVFSFASGNARPGSENGPARSKLERHFGKALLERLSGVLFTLSPQAFFQVNRNVAEKVLASIREALLDSGSKGGLLIDLYSGIGTLSMPLSDCFDRVIAVESHGQSCNMAALNSRANKLENYEIINADAKRALPRVLEDSRNIAGSEAALLLDPPQEGLDSGVINGILGSRFGRIFYLSCNPHTQERDINRITREGSYRLVSVTPFDMFPQTFHIESLAVLESVKAG